MVCSGDFSRFLNPRAVKVAITIFLLAFLFLASCSSLFAFTPERAAIRMLLNPNPMFPREIVPGSVQVAQSQPWQDGVAVLLAYNIFEEGSGNSDCLSLFTVTKKRSRWSPQEEDISCTPAGGTGEVISMSSGAGWGTDSPGESYLSGLVYDRRVVAVEVHWDDGEIEQLAVINGTFFSIRAGVHELGQYLPLDENGEQVR